MPFQLPLNISLRDDATFDNFYCAPASANQTLVASLKQQIVKPEHSVVYCWGGEGSGVTHLLQAACHYGSNNGLTTQYLPLQELVDFPAQAIMEGMEQMDVLCLDDVQCARDNRDWQQVLFDLINKMRDNGRRLVLGANNSPTGLGIEREDLISRLAWGGVFQVSALDDNEKKEALQMRAKARGMNLSEDVADFILKRASRGSKELFELLERLDAKSLISKRRLTIPFVREVMEEFNSQ